MIVHYFYFSRTVSNCTVHVTVDENLAPSIDIQVYVVS